CTLGGIERLALFHHDPARDDAGVEAIEAEARRHFANAFAARESAVVVL
ncbi:MAG: MBL fold metallo-hydrolase, partial [Alphaproteobacteria bacterium]|nr:MBL fold metallo-hydrolase [Alphaproteobacteria bacterium]